MVSIILVSFNLGEMTKKCIESIRLHVRGDYEIILIDNASEQETVDILDKIPDIILIKNQSNVGFPKACNQGIEKANGDVIWLLNNDTIVPPYSFDIMLDLLLSDTSIGVVGPVTNSIRGRQQIGIDYSDMDGMIRFAEQRRKEHKGETWQMFNIVGFSMLIRKADLLECGGMDERMRMGTFEDDLLCVRLALRQKKILVAADAFIHHFGNASFKAAGGYPKTNIENQIITSQIAGVTVPTDITINKDWIQLIPTECKRVLHVETGGALGFYLRENGIRADALISNKRSLEFVRQSYDNVYTYVVPERLSDALVFDNDLNNETVSYDFAVLENLRSNAQIIFLLRVLSCLLNENSTILFFIPRIFGKNLARKEMTYQEIWEENSQKHLVSEIDILELADQLDWLGYELEQCTYQKMKQGFFNTCAHQRYKSFQIPVYEEYSFFYEYWGIIRKK